MNIGLVIIVCLLVALLALVLARATPLYPPFKRGHGAAGHVECDLTGARRPCFRVRISRKWPVLHVYTPSKATADRLVTLGPALGRLSRECVYSEQVATDEAEVFSLAVTILSHNRENFPDKQIEALIDREQALVFLCDYLGWLTDLLERKN